MLFTLPALYARLVWFWQACVWSFYSFVLGSAAALFVLNFVSRLSVGLLTAGSVAMKLVLAKPDVARLIVSSASLLVLSRSAYGLPVVLGRRVHNVFRVWFSLQRPLCAQPVSLSRIPCVLL